MKSKNFYKKKKKKLYTFARRPLLLSHSLLSICLSSFWMNSSSPPLLQSPHPSALLSSHSAHMATRAGLNQRWEVTFGLLFFLLRAHVGDSTYMIRIKLQPTLIASCFCTSSSSSLITFSPDQLHNAAEVESCGCTLRTWVKMVEVDR